jgi:spore coat protein A
MDAHPIHLHLVSSQLVNRQKFIAQIDPQNGKPNNIRVIGQPRLPSPDEQGWKDTWVMNPGEVTRIIAKFDLEGLYVWHCHILSHEDHEMMRPFFVGEMSQQKGKRELIKNATSELERQVKLQAIPNPFSTSFMLRFNLAQLSKVAVNMYDEKGSLIKRVNNGELSKGMQELSIDGLNLSDGIYYCEVIINNQRIVRKMVLKK